jgi:hypothetical protein
MIDSSLESWVDLQMCHQVNSRLLCLAPCGSTFWSASPKRAITVEDLRTLRSRVVTEPWAPDGDWYKDFGSFIICGTGEYPKTVPKKGMKPFGTAL